MNKIKTINAEKLLKRQLQNKAFKNEYELLEKDFEIAREIIRLRKSAKLTQKELAKIAGTSQPAIARLESGNYRNLSLSFLNRVANALGAEPKVSFKKIKVA